MHVVIDIPESQYKMLKISAHVGVGDFVYKIVANGTPLPKGHGRLIEAEKVVGLIFAKTTIELYQSEWEEIEKAISGMPTIIEAERSE